MSNESWSEPERAGEQNPQPGQYQQPAQYQQPGQYQQPAQYQQPGQYQQSPGLQVGYGYPPPQVFVQQPSNGLGVAGFVTGLLGLIFCWVPFLGLVLGILGVILGGAGIATGHKSGAGTGLAISGLILGIISLIPAAIVIAALS